MEVFFNLSLVSGIAALVALSILHFVSPEFQPNWRMISEYALGKYKFLITSFFFLWAASSIFLVVALWEFVDNAWAWLGLILLFLSAIGELMGGMFDIKHKLHGFSFMLGVPSLPIAALILSYQLVNTSAWTEDNALVIIAAHATWISLIIMGIAMGVMMSGFKKSGIPMGPDVAPPEKVPVGVIALAGYANRFLVICYIGWMITIAFLRN